MILPRGDHLTNINGSAKREFMREITKRPRVTCNMMLLPPCFIVGMMSSDGFPPNEAVTQTQDISPTCQETTHSPLSPLPTYLDCKFTLCALIYIEIYFSCSFGSIQEPDICWRCLDPGNRCLSLYFTISWSLWFNDIVFNDPIHWKFLVWCHLCNWCRYLKLDTDSLTTHLFALKKNINL